MRSGAAVAPELADLSAPSLQSCAISPVTVAVSHLDGPVAVHISDVDGPTADVAGTAEATSK